MQIAHFVGLLLALAWQLSGNTERQAPEVTAADVKKYVGRDVTICGRVVTYDCEQSSGSLLLDLDTPIWASGVTVSVGRQYWTESSGQLIPNRYLFGRVCARGTVMRAARRYRVAIHARDQPQLISGPAITSNAFAPGAIQSCAEGVTPPVLLREVKPSYTREAMRHRQEGKVYLEALVLPDGSVGDIRVLYALEPDYGLTQQAVGAVKQWRFRAGAFGGRSAPVVITATESFVLR